MSKLTPAAVLDAIQRLAQAGQLEVSSTDVVHATHGSSATVRRHLDALCGSGQLTRSGQARATRYRLAGVAAAIPTAARRSLPPARKLGLPQAPGFQAMLLEELKKLEVFNCARYRLTPTATQAWIDANRPY